MSCIYFKQPTEQETKEVPEPQEVSEPNAIQDNQQDSEPTIEVGSIKVFKSQVIITTRRPKCHHLLTILI